jgi:formylglycine-generating enzyme required for sulfatase activity
MEMKAMKKVSVAVIFALIVCLPVMSAQVGRPNAPAKKPPAKPKPRVDRGSAALKELFNSFVQIPAGEFLMGSENGDADETPVHRVRISRPFEMGKYEVTQAQWEAVMGINNPSFIGGGNYPVQGVSWDEAQKFIQNLNERNDGYSYRLSTEAEWEYACRAGTTTEFAFGDSLSSNQARFDGHWGGSTDNKVVMPVGSFRPNAWGLYDMHGNVWEWCQDWYDENYYAKSPSVDPKGPSTGSDRVSRGGGWLSDARDCRSASRSRHAPHNEDDEPGKPGSRYVDSGFRIVRTRR